MIVHFTVIQLKAAQPQIEEVLHARARWLAQNLPTHWVIHMQDEYHALSYKTMALWRLVEDHFDIDYLIKVDDDNFVRLDRLSIATHQWDEENAGLHSKHPMNLSDHSLIPYQQPLSPHVSEIHNGSCLEGQKLLPQPRTLQA